MALIVHYLQEVVAQQRQLLKAALYSRPTTNQHIQLLGEAVQYAWSIHQELAEGLPPTDARHVELMNEAIYEAVMIYHQLTDLAQYAETRRSLHLELSIIRERQHLTRALYEALTVVNQRLAEELAGRIGQEVVSAEQALPPETPSTPTVDRDLAAGGQGRGADEGGHRR